MHRWPAVSYGLASMLADEAGFEVKCVKSETVDRITIEQLRPFELLVVGEEFENVLTQDFLSRFLRQDFSVPVLYLTTRSTMESELVATLNRLGTRGFAPMTVTKEDLVRIVRFIVDDRQVYLHASLNENPLWEILAIGTKNAGPIGEELTQREREVFKLLADGHSVKEVAKQLDISLKTAESHKYTLMRKLDVHNKNELLIRAVELGVVRVKTPADC